jgi:hypothetical protein
MEWLSEKEQDALREDYREIEREIQRNFGIYLSGLVLVVGWIVGPGSKSLLEMIRGNSGYNGYALLALCFFNIIFTCFLLYKSLGVHEIMQLLILRTKPGSGYQQWESWRRSKQSATKRARPFYMMFLLGLPVAISALILYGLARVLWQTHILDKRFGWMWFWWWVVLLFHAFPLWFGWENLGPTPRRWKTLGVLKTLDGRFDRISRSSVPPVEDAVALRRLTDGSHIANLDPADASAFSARSMSKYVTVGGFELNADSLRALERERVSSSLLNSLRDLLTSKNEIVQIRFTRSGVPMSEAFPLTGLPLGQTRSAT